MGRHSIDNPDDSWDELLGDISTTPEAPTPQAAGSARTRGSGVVQDTKQPSLLIRLIGYLGELLITAGLVIGLFIVWQVWWTDLLANREQSDRVASATHSWVQPAEKVGAARTDNPPAVDRPTEVGAVEGVLRVPRFGKDYAHTIEYGTGLKAVLNTGAFGHYADTAYAGEVGNFALAAHRQTYGAPMKNVEDLKIGDPIIVETKSTYLVYYVTESYVVEPENTDVIAPVPNNPNVAPTERKLTITTCHPPFVSDKRWVIHATYDHWVDRADGIPSELSQEK